MKNLLLIISMFSFLFILGQNNPPEAVNDTIFEEVNVGDFITINVIANDYDPDGDYIYVYAANHAHSFTDSTITYYLDFNLYGGMSGEISFFYSIKDEHGLFGNNSGAHVVLINFVNTGFAYLDTNNIKARFNSFGNHFWDLPGGIGAHYEYPKGSGHHSMFNFTFWMGGIDENDQLRVAGERYRQNGIDYWTGPISMGNNNIWIDSSTVYEWLNVWKLNIDEVEYHKIHWNDTGYEPIENILNWPAHGDIEIGQSQYLAPFVDIDGDSLYQPMQGDYPLIRGDQTLFFIFNDLPDHTETGGETIGIEIHGFAYAFYAPENLELHNTTFLSYKIFNRSQHTLSDTYAGLFTDIDLGYAYDDFVGCDIARGAYYCYNGEEIDGNGEPEAYGANPPAQGVIVLGGPYLDPDGNDNPSGQCDESINGLGFGDGIEDNERFGMNNFIYFNNMGPVYQVDPEIDYEYYNYMKGMWRDSILMEYGGNGHPSSGAYGPAANFMFPGLSDPCNWGTGGEPPFGPVDWTEETSGNEYGDRRGLCSMGPFTLEPGGFHKIDIAFVTARGDSLINSVDLLMEYIDSVKTFYFEDPDHFAYQYLGDNEKIFKNNKLSVYPNPTNSVAYINYTPETNRANYIIYNGFGRKVSDGILNKSNIHKIDISDFEPGLYILEVTDGNSNMTFKLLKK